ncbi:hypothetical protein [Alteromonas sp. KUL106]|uniref:hypothetical protein n=1 Tax=Alteromonas sp. KUL106 TaxID=2480799 RepID=UPI0012E50C9A|nr:hypothetical protein [Alteromonas sp. KUL106]GFD68970.1 hypothetical protein KUL106_22330 [Alteromonas sp. KUL106]
MEFVSKAYREGRRSGRYSNNPYEEDTKEYNEFERGVTQTLRITKEEPFKASGGFYIDPDDDLTGSVPYKKSANLYLLKRKK